MLLNFLSNDFIFLIFLLICLYGPLIFYKYCCPALLSLAFKFFAVGSLFLELIKPILTVPMKFLNSPLISLHHLFSH